MKKILVAAITLYQKTLSPDHGWLRGKYPNGFCRYYPSCSEYAKQAIIEYGAVRGSVKAAVRVAKCNPFSAGGIDHA